MNNSKPTKTTTPSSGSSTNVDGIRPRGSALFALQSSISRLQKSVAASVFKIATTFGIAGAVVAGSLSLGGTISYFSDIEKSVNNTFIADPLYFSVDASSTQIDMSAGPQQVTAFMTPGEGSEPIQYFVTASTTGGDPNFCGAIKLLGTAPFVYDGTLLSLASATSTETGPWTLTFSLPYDQVFAPSTSCTVDLTYHGWNASAAGGQGYKDTETLSMEFFVPATSTLAAEPVDPAPSGGGGEVLGDATTTPTTDTSDASTTPAVDAASSTPEQTSSDASSTPPTDTSTLNTDTSEASNVPAETQQSALPADTTSSPPPSDQTPPPTDPTPPGPDPASAPTDTSAVSQ